LPSCPGVVPSPGAPDVFSAREIGRAAGVPESHVLALIEAGAIRALPIGSREPLVDGREALRAGLSLAAGLALPLPLQPDTTMFAGPRAGTPTVKAPFAVSSLAHAGAVAAVVLVTTLGLGQTVSTQATPARNPDKLRLVYLALPGPGGGGGGGGLKQQAPPPKAQRRGQRTLSSPLPVRQPPPEPKPIERPKDPEPPEVKPEPLPPVEAPIVNAPADERDKPGVLEETPQAPDSRGPGAGGGAGTGEGTGIGEGQGTGVGEGEGGGTGGGPFRPGSGIEPPSLLREVKPDYTENARQRGIEGDVVMEIVVRRDGTVGDVRVMQGLGYGLDERAVQAVRQWRFSPARRRGQPVDVMVEVAMEFKIR
jgi:periplasmic protein TonB